MSGSTMPIAGLLARAAYHPSRDNISLVLPEPPGGLTTWALLISFVAVTIYWTAITLRHIPMVHAQSRFGWLNNLLSEPRGPDVSEYPQTTPNKGLLRYAGLLGQQRVLVTSLQGFHEVLQEKSYTFNKWDVTKRVLGPLMGDGMLLTEGDTHRAQRKLLGPAFAPRHIQELHPVFWKKTADFVQALDKEISSNTKTFTTVPFSIWASRATFDIISLAVFGGDSGMLKNPTAPLANAYGNLFALDQLSNLRSTLGVLLPRSFLQALPLKRNKTIAASNETIRDFCRQSIRHEKAEMKAGKNAESLNIINVALRSKKFEDEELIDQLMTILVAGHETTAHSVSWAVHFLAQQPELQSRVRAEIRASLPSPDSDQKFKPACLDALPYLHAVCEEVLRLMPVIPILYRQANEATSILGSAIPKDTVIALSPWTINRNKEVWGEDADTFNPDRWMGESNPASGEKLNKYSFSSFSHGPRSCIGFSFARAELAALLAGIIGSFEFMPEQTPDLSFGLVTLKPRGGLKVQLRKLEGW